MADTCICLCKHSGCQELTSLCFSVLKAIDPILFQSYKEGCNKAGAAQENDGHASPLPKLGAARPEGPRRSCLPQGYCDTWQLPNSILPLGKAPSESHTLLDHDSHLLHSILVAVPNFAVPWHTCFPLCVCRQQSRSALNDIQKCKFCSPQQSYQLQQSVLEH